MRIFALLTLFIVAFTITSPAFASWTLDGKHSTLTFMSIKKNSVAENHTFTGISGEVSQQGQVKVAIDLMSVNTNIEIRDERMKEHLFHTSSYPKAIMTAQLDKEMLDDMAVGSRKTMLVTGVLSLHGQQQTLTFSVMVARLSSKEVMVASTQPIIINAAGFDLVKGINKLQALAGLPSISHAVPVSFVLSFQQ